MEVPRNGVLLAATAIVSVAATLLARDIIGNEPPVAGAVAATLPSTVLGEDREYLVYLPEGYASDSTTRYPVLYVLDGASQSGHTAESARLLARIGIMPPVIVVGLPSPDSDARNRDYTPPDMRLDTDVAVSAMGAADRFHTFLNVELVPRIEREYRATRPRMLAGWSRSGLFVVYSALTAPALFDARFAHSPALWRENDRIVEGLERVLQSGTLSRGFLYLSLGAAENEKMTKSFQHAVQVLGRGAPSTLRWRADFSVGGEHESNPRLSMPVGLCAMFADSASWSCRRAEVPGRSVSDRVTGLPALAATIATIRPSPLAPAGGRAGEPRARFARGGGPRGRRSR